MNLTVGQLKTILKNVDDNMLIATMDFGNHFELKTFCVKRGLILESDSQEKIFCFNNMGTHWKKEWEDKNFVKCVAYVDRNTGEITKQ